MAIDVGGAEGEIEGLQLPAEAFDQLLGCRLLAKGRLIPCEALRAIDGVVHFQQILRHGASVSAPRAMMLGPKATPRSAQELMHSARSAECT
jgi:hypothetical protein